MVALGTSEEEDAKLSSTTSPPILKVLSCECMHVCARIHAYMALSLCVRVNECEELVTLHVKMLILFICMCVCRYVCRHMCACVVRARLRACVCVCK
jgi:hypothetical protein